MVPWKSVASVNTKGRTVMVRPFDVSECVFASLPVPLPYPWEVADTSHLVIGSGEVGTSLHAVLKSTFGDLAAIRDVEPVEGQYDVIHVCIPWSESFVDTVHRYADDHRASMVIVHSTVPVGTCDDNGWVHSPVRGRHPNLYEGLMFFVKHVGGRNAECAAELLSKCGMVTEIHDKASTTEAGKLWELVQFGIQVAIQKDVYAWCDESGLDGNEVYAGFAMTYNDGYRRLGEDRFTRPVIRPEADPKIGGHCVTANAEHLDHPWAKIIRGR